MHSNLSGPIKSVFYREVFTIGGSGVRYTEVSTVIIYHCMELVHVLRIITTGHHTSLTVHPSHPPQNGCYVDVYRPRLYKVVASFWNTWKAVKNMAVPRPSTSFFAGVCLVLMLCLHRCLTVDYDEGKLVSPLLRLDVSSSLNRSYKT